MPDICNLDALSDEVKVNILTMLDSAADLVTAARLNKRWCRLAEDEQVWKRLLSKDFPQSQRLPHESIISFKAFYRLQSNWSNGRATPIRLSLRSSVLPAVPASLSVDGDASPPHKSAQQDSAPNPDTIVAFSGHYIFTASRKADPTNVIPSIHLETILPNGQSSLLGSLYSSSIVDYYTNRHHLVGPDFALTVTEMQLDEASHCGNFFRLAIFFSSGQYALLQISINGKSISVVEEYASLELTNNPVASAKYHCPLLITLSRSSLLHFYLIRKKTSSAQFQLILSHPPLQADLIWAPASLSLKRQSKNKFKASFVYSTPYFSYPSSWTIGIQEFHLRLPKDVYDGSKGIEMETHSALCIPQLTCAQSESLLTAIKQSDSSIVASRLDNTIDLFEVVPYRNAKRPLQLIQRRSLFGHSCSVNSLMLKGERCVSAGRDGRVRVWDLSNANKARAPQCVEVREEPQEPESEAWSHQIEGEASVEWLSFDSEKVVCLEAPSIQRPAADRLKVLSFNPLHK